MSHSIEEYLQLTNAAPAGFSRDGERLLVVSNATGTRQLYTIPLAGGEMRHIATGAEPVNVAEYIPGTDAILFQTDIGGNERLQMYRINEDGSGLTAVVEDPDFIHRFGGISHDGRCIAFASNRRNGRAFDIYVQDLVSGEQKVVFEADGWAEAAGFSPDGRLLAVITRNEERALDGDLHLVDLGTGERHHLTPHDEPSQFSALSWLPDSSSAYFSGSAGRDFATVARYNPATGRWAYVDTRDHDVDCAIDSAGRYLLLRINDGGYDRLELRDPLSFELCMEVPLPGDGAVSLGDAVSSFGPTFSADGRHLAFAFVSASEPGDVWVFDTETRELRRLTSMPRAVPAAEMVHPESHRFASFDGLSVPAFVYRPRESTEAPPVVVFVHGGPESQYRPTYNPAIQYLVSRGFAVVAPNVRGSTGYGKRYASLDDVRLRPDCIRDLASLHAWLPTVGLDQNRAALIGQSYGGYMTLAGLAFQPELWAAGVDFYGIANMVSFLENTSEWRRKVREVEYGSLERDRDFLREISPLTRVDDIRAPLFLMHGENDPRVPISESRQLRAALEARGITVEMVVYPDEGHGITRLANRLDVYPRVAAFLERTLS